jgi:hypothetical protein
MPIWTLAKKELRLLSRDRLGFTILFVMPLLFVMILGLLTGEGFGQKPDTRLRISLLDQDKGYPDNPAVRETMTWLAFPPTSSGLALPRMLPEPPHARFSPSNCPIPGPRWCAAILS